MAVAGVALEPNPDAVDGVRAADIGEGEVGDDVLVLVRVIVVLELGPEVGLREIEVHADDLVDGEDVVSVNLRLKPKGRQERGEEKEGCSHGPQGTPRMQAQRTMSGWRQPHSATSTM